MKKFLFLIVMIAMGVGMNYAKPTIAVRGVVVSKINDELIVGAIVKSITPEATVTTDVDGQFVINVEEGSKLEISCVGYKTQKVKARPNMVIDLTPNDYRAMHWFVAATAGPVIVYKDKDYYYWDSFNPHGDSYVAKYQAEFGVMFGMMGRNWGWYVRPSMPVAFAYSDFKTQYTGSLGFGAIRRLVDNFNIYAGSGVGCGLFPRYFYHYYDDNRKRYESDFGDSFAVMFELGFQYNIKHINIELGLQYAMGTNDPQRQGNFKPYVGVGYNFK